MLYTREKAWARGAVVARLLCRNLFPPLAQKASPKRTFFASWNFAKKFHQKNAKLVPKKQEAGGSKQEPLDFHKVGSYYLP